ncbi:acyltransferase [Gelidibacter japonicus]|uniref:acyltransferase n=1 Tax=Gelidibacter japonicus TaxID=1962232 RepID=UPI0013CF9FDA|nr:DapH/DapD/GlmU-related protein [Gelidibacter japonicus]
MNALKQYVKSVFRRLAGVENNSDYLEKLKGRGLRVGTHFNMQKDVILDDTHCWLITIGNYVTIAPRVQILCHDASTKHALEYTKIGPVTIGDYVFVGANSIIMPSVTIGNNVIIAAGSVVTKDVPENTLVSGVPAQVVGKTSDYIDTQRTLLKSSPRFDERFTLNAGVDSKQKQEMLNTLNQTSNKKGFIV